MNPLQTLNVSNINEVTTEQFVKLANNYLAMPELIIFGIFIGIVFLIVGLSIVNQNSRKKYFIIWFTSMIISSIFLLILVYMPNTIYSFIEQIKSWFA